MRLASVLAVNDIQAELLPQDKLDYMKRLRKQQRKFKHCLRASAKKNAKNTRSQSWRNFLTGLTHHHSSERMPSQRQLNTH